MIENLNFLRREERLALELKFLYTGYGYTAYKLSSFDEYALYANNQSFLAGKDVISLNVGDKLLALRPDVTLSIIKNYPFGGGTEKLFYDEKVYRKSPRGGFSEVSQIGVEVIGEVDLAVEAEICTLMTKTLAAVGRQFVLDISHMGIVTKAVNALKLRENDAQTALSFLENKNVHDFVRFAKARGADEKATAAFETLMKLPGEPLEAKKKLGEIGKTFGGTEEIKELYALIALAPQNGVRVDFSIGGDADYYNGVIFKGYIEGVPEAVLSGGRYDKLLAKFNRGENALGFALYLGQLGKYLEAEEEAPCAVLVYDGENPAAALEEADRLRAAGKRVLMTRKVPAGFTGEIYGAEGKND